MLIHHAALRQCPLHLKSQKLIERVEAYYLENLPTALKPRTRRTTIQLKPCNTNDWLLSSSGIKDEFPWKGSPSVPFCFHSIRSYRLVNLSVFIEAIVRTQSFASELELPR